jgi:dipeptidyl aminopeptidase/acylaminoacyl peptidase
MPRIPYLVIHGKKDTGVAKKKHSDVLVPRMRKAGLKVEYHEVPEMGHCSPIPPKLWQRQTEFVIGHLKGGKRR